MTVSGLDSIVVTTVLDFYIPNGIWSYSPHTNETPYNTYGILESYTTPDKGMALRRITQSDGYSASNSYGYGSWSGWKILSQV